MPQQIKDNARSILAASITTSGTSITVPTGKGDLFPTADAGTNPVSTENNWFKVTLELVDGRREIAYVRTRSVGSDILSNVLRAQEGTTALECPSGTVVGLRITAKDFQDAILFSGTQEWRDLPVVTISGGHAIVADNRGKCVSVTGNVTLAAGVLSPGNIVTVTNQGGSPITFTPGSGLDAFWINASGARTLAPGYGMMTIYCVSSNRILIIGQGIS